MTSTAAPAVRAQSRSMATSADPASDGSALLSAAIPNCSSRPPGRAVSSRSPVAHRLRGSRAPRNCRISVVLPIQAGPVTTANLVLPEIAPRSMPSSTASSAVRPTKYSSTAQSPRRRQYSLRVGAIRVQFHTATHSRPVLLLPQSTGSHHQRTRLTSRVARGRDPRQTLGTRTRGPPLGRQRPRRRSVYLCGPSVRGGAGQCWPAPRPPT
jgi:hypothetical protein